MAGDEKKSSAPSIEKSSFACAHCGAIAAQTWTMAVAAFPNGRPPARSEVDNSPPVFSGMLQPQGFMVSQIRFARCHHCEVLSIWVGDRMVYPSTQGLAIAPNADLDPDIQKDFEEARQIAAISPRGAAALLRLAVQKLCKQLGEPGKNIDQDIGNLVAKGLSPLLQKALDTVRVIGNEQVHPGELDLRDDLETATYLFDLVNMIADQMLTQPKAVEAVYSKLPQPKRDAIDVRNASAIKK